MIRRQRMEAALQNYFQPSILQLENESHQHSVPVNSETHFKLIMVSEKFENQSRVQRQRSVMDLLKNEFSTGLHALTQKLLTPAEWEKEKSQLNFESPVCHGGSKFDRK